MSNTTAVKLEDNNGYLALPGGDTLLCIYPAGDCDNIQWPNPDKKNLFSALFDKREMGEIPSDCSEVELPDGSTMNF